MGNGSETAASCSISAARWQYGPGGFLASTRQAARSIPDAAYEKAKTDEYS